MLSLLNDKKGYGCQQEFAKCLIGNRVGFFCGHQVGENYFQGVSFVNLKQCLRGKAVKDIPILPITYGEQRFVLAHNDELREKGFLSFINNRSLLELCNNKMDFTKYVKRIGMTKFLPENLSYCDAMDIVSDKHIVIAKPITGFFGKGTVLCRSKEDLRRLNFDKKINYLF